MPKKLVQTTTNKQLRPALTPEAREDQLISLAVDLAEQQLLNGTASSQVITHFLKLGSSREKLEQELLKKNQALVDAKRENLETSRNAEELYANALEAMRTYSGTNDGDDLNEY